MSVFTKIEAIDVPDKPSDLIELALGEVEKIEGNGWYTVDMGLWHDVPVNDHKCHVCLAGCVMVRLGANRNARFNPESWGGGWSDALHALNQWRDGKIGCGFRFYRRSQKGRPELYKWSEFGLPDEMAVPPYGLNSDGFKLAMKEMASLFRKAGL